MRSGSLLLRYGFTLLVWLAGVEWFLGRAISRVAASPALEGDPRAVIEWMGAVGLFLVAPASLLAAYLYVASLLTAGAEAIRSNRRIRVALALYLAAFAVISALYVMIGPASWLATSYSILAIIAIWWLTLAYTPELPASIGVRAAILAIIAAYTGYLLYIVLQQLGAATTARYVSATLVRDLGEIAVVTAPFAFFAATAVPFGQWKRVRRWVLPVVLVLALAIGNIADMAADQGFVGVFAIWSIGLSYYLPWPLYAISLSLYVYAVLTCFSREADKSAFATPSRGKGLLLLAFASYELQFPYQYILALLSLMLLVAFVAPSVEPADVVVSDVAESEYRQPTPDNPTLTRPV